MIIKTQDGREVRVVRGSATLTIKNENREWVSFLVGCRLCNGNGTQLYFGCGSIGSLTLKRHRQTVDLILEEINGVA